MSFITRFLIKNALAVVIVSSLLTVVGGYYSIHLFSNLRTSLEELLPAQARSVLDLNEVKARLESTNSLSVLVMSENVEASKKFVIDLAAEIEKLPRDVAAGVEYRINRELAFFNNRKSLFIQYEDLLEIKKFIRDRINYEIQLYNPLTILENRSIPEPKLDFKALEKKYTSKTDQYSRFADGFYASADEKIRVLLVNLPGSAAGIDDSHKLRHAIDNIVLTLNTEKYAPDLQVQYSGGVQDLIDEHEALIEDLLLSTVVVCGLVLMFMLYYFRSFFATSCLLAGLFAGVFWTFGLGFFQVGYLNANSAFMGSIVIGNGINFGIILLARYMEERRKGKGTPRSVAIAVEHTASATIVAALAAGLAYGSLILTSFRGFRQFGVIGLTGMILCWASCYTLTPALMIVLYRLGLLQKPVSNPKPLISHFVVGLVQRASKPILIVTAGITVVSALQLGRIDKDIIETDMKKLRNKKSAQSGSMYWGKYVDEVFQRYLSPIVVLPKKPEDTALIAAKLRKIVKDEKGKSFIVNVSTIEDFVPPLQEEKVKVLKEIDHLLPKPLLSRLDGREKKMAKDLLSPQSFEPFTQDYLPELVKSKFREKDGTIGKLVLVEPSMSPELAKSDNLIHFIHSIREASDSVAPGTAVAGTLPVTSDLFESIVKDGPKATLFAFIAVLLLVVVLFRNKITIAQCAFALILGVLWLFGYILGFHQKINFLNFIALPITFGIGVDYGVNVFQRYRLERSKGILVVLRQTGGAVLLASLTTITGYGSLLIASNQAFVSFGRLAILGEITCVVAAVLSLPALIYYLEERKKKKETHEPLEAHPSSI